MRLASDGVGEAVVGTVTRLGILSASATRLAAFDGAFGKGATPHGPSVGQIRGELPDMRRGTKGSGSRHALSYGANSRKIKAKNKSTHSSPHSTDVHPSEGIPLIWCPSCGRVHASRFRVKEYEHNVYPSTRLPTRLFS